MADRGEGVEPATGSPALGQFRAASASLVRPVIELPRFAVAALAAVVRAVARRRLPWPEFVGQAWFIASVCILPTVLIAIPFGLIVALQVANIARQIGATSYIGAVDAIGTLREGSPIVTALLLAGAGGAAICSDLGARTIKEEVDALRVMGLDPMEHWIAPRVLAALLVAVLLNGIVAFVGIMSGYIFYVTALHGTPGSYLGSFSAFARVDDIVVSTIKAGVFGMVAAIVASYKGLGVKRGAAGVGMAVNEFVVMTGILLFGINVVITQVYFALFPPRLA